MSIFKIFIFYTEGILFLKKKREINKESALGKLSGLYSCEGDKGLDWPVGRGGASTEQVSAWVGAG